MIEPSDHQCVGSRDASSNAGEVLANEYALAGTGRASSFTWPCTPTGPCVGVRGRPRAVTCVRYVCVRSRRSNGNCEVVSSATSQLGPSLFSKGLVPTRARITHTCIHTWGAPLLCSCGRPYRSAVPKHAFAPTVPRRSCPVAEPRNVHIM